MNYKAFVSILLLVFVLPFCTNQNNQDDNSEQSDRTNRDSNITVDPGSVNDEQGQKKNEIILSPSAEELYLQGRDFFKWYIKNRSELLINRENILKIDSKNYFFVDLKLLDKYINYLKTNAGDYLSKNFIKSEFIFWQDVLKELEKDPVHYEDGPDPWNFEADPIFNAQEWPESFEEWSKSWTNIDKSSIQISGETGEFVCDIKFKWVKENNRWKLKGWPSVE